MFKFKTVAPIFNGYGINRKIYFYLKHPVYVGTVNEGKINR